MNRKLTSYILQCSGHDFNMEHTTRSSPGVFSSP